MTRVTRIFSLGFLLGFLFFILGACDNNSGLRASKISKVKSNPPPINFDNQTNYSLSGTCSLAQSEIGIRIGVLSEITVTCSKDLTWEATGLNISDIPDNKEILISIRQGDNASVNNGLLLELRVIKDTLNPTVALDPPSFINKNNQSSFILEGDCSEDEQAVSVTIGDLPEQTVDCMSLEGSLEWSLETDVSALTTDTVSILVDSVDAAGNSAPQEATTVDRDVVAPIVALTTPELTITSINHKSYSLQGTCETGYDVVLSLGTLDSDTLTCANDGTWALSNKDVSALPDGNNISLQVEQQDALENLGQDQQVIIKDTLHPAPVLTTTSLFINTTNEGSYSLEGRCEGVEEVSITLGTQNTESSSCSGGQWSYSVDSSLSEGSYELTIAQEDMWGNSERISPAPTLIKDVILPTVGLASNQDINAANASNYRPQGSCSEEGTVTITVASLPSATASCNGGSDWQLNPGINASGLDDGASINVALSMVDLAGNSSILTATTVSKDITSRAVVIDVPAIINIANETDYPVSGTCSDHTDSMSLTVGGLSPNSEPICISAGTWSTSLDVSSLEDGSNVVINVSFGAGSAEVTDSDTVLKDTERPTVGISPSLPPINKTNQTHYDLWGTCSENGRLGEVSVGDLTPQAVSCSSYQWEILSYDVSSLTGSSITMTADLSDAAGNPAESALVTVDRDVEAPIPTLSTSFLHVNKNNVTQYSLEGSCEDGLDVTVTLGDLPPWTLVCNSGSWALVDEDVTNLSEGSDILLTIKQTDTAGNEGDRSATLTKDTTEPTLSLTSPLLVNANNVSAFSLQGTCSEDEEGELVNIIIASRSGVTAPCTSMGWQHTADLETGLSDGDISLRLTLEDAMGNSVEDTFTLSRDTVSPTLTLDIPLPSMNIGNANSYTVEGDCDIGDSIILSTEGLSSQPNTSCDINRRWAISTGDFSSLADNTNITLRATVTDTHGNETQESATFDKDTEAPIVSIDELVEITQTNEASYPLAGGCNEEGKEVQISAGNFTPPSFPTCTGGRWSLQMDFSSLSEAININALQRDGLDNLGSAPIRTLVRDAIRQRFFYSRIATGGNHTCMITRESQVLCWGYFQRGELGNDQTGTSSNNKQSYPADYVVNGDGSSIPLTGVISLAAGNSHTCALTTAGQVWCWGRGDNGQLGNDAMINSDHPVAVVDGDGSSTPLTGVISLAAGYSHTCALTTTGRVWCWGSGTDGQLGNDAMISSDHPVAVVDGDGSTNPLTGIVALEAGNRYTCVLTSGRGALCWGQGANGQLGSSSETYSYYDDDLGIIFLGVNRDTPLPVLVVEEGALLSGVVEIYVGKSHTCALLEDSGVKCWGSEFAGGLGNGSDGDFLNLVAPSTAQFFPVDVLVTPGGASFTGVTELKVFNNGSCVITDLEEKMNCWGTNKFGQLGIGEIGEGSFRPTPVATLAGKGSPETLNSIREIAGGSMSHFVCVVPSTGGILCWGRNTQGQLGNNTLEDRPTPVLVVAEEDSKDFLNNFSSFRRTYSCEQGSCGQDPVDQVQLALASTSPTPSTNASISIDVSGLASGDSLSLYNSKDCSDTAVATTTSNSSVNVSGLSEGSHAFHFQITAGLDSSVSECSKSFLSYHYDATDPEVVTLSLANASGTNTTPDVTVSGIEPGNLVKLYSDSSCTTLAAEAVRVNGVEKDITVNALTSAGDYTFYAKTTDQAGNVSECTSGVIYTLN